MPATKEKPFTAQAIASVEPPTARPIVGIAITKPSHTTHPNPMSKQTAASDRQRSGLSVAPCGAGEPSADIRTH